MYVTRVEINLLIFTKVDLKRQNRFTVSKKYLIIGGRVNSL